MKKRTISERRRRRIRFSQYQTVCWMTENPIHKKLQALPFFQKNRLPPKYALHASSAISALFFFVSDVEGFREGVEMVPGGCGVRVVGR